MHHLNAKTYASGPISTPSNPTHAYGLPQPDIEEVGQEYFDKIESPMDLGTIQKRLAPGEQQGWAAAAYRDAAAVLSDVELVFQNCRTFYHPNDDIMCVAGLAALDLCFRPYCSPVTGSRAPPSTC